MAEIYHFQLQGSYDSSLQDSDPTLLRALWVGLAMRYLNTPRAVFVWQDQQLLRRSETSLGTDTTLAELALQLETAAVDESEDTAVIGFSHETWADQRESHPAIALTWSPIETSVQFEPSAIDIEQVEHLVERFGDLLGASNPESRLASVPVIGPVEARLIDEWNATSRLHDHDAPLIDMFDAQVDRTPDAAAVEVGGTVTTYLELQTMAKRVSSQLRSLGVESGDAVALCVDRSLQLAIGMLGILRTGAAYVPVDPAYPEQRRSYMIEDCAARIVVADRTTASIVADAPDQTVITVEELLDEDAEPTQVDGATGRDGGYIIYTSGSTGQPKGVWMPQRALTNLIAWQLRRPQAVAQPRTLQFSALSFDVSFQEVFSTWASGGTLVMISDENRRDSNSLLDSLVDLRIDRLFLPFVALRALAQTAVRTGRFPHRLREVYTAGEQLQVDDALRRFFAELPDCVLENQYGPSESHVCSAHTVTGPESDWPALPPIGGPIDNTTLLVLDHWNHHRPIGAVGELFIGGSCLADGYHNKPDLTAERFVDLEVANGSTQRLYRTGDLAKWLPNGDLEFLGRSDGQVKIRGFRIEPGEVTTVLASAPGVNEAVATVRSDLGGDTPRLVGYLVSHGQDLDLAAVKNYVASRLPEYMVPTHWAVIDEFPLTPSGKLAVRSLPAPEFDRGTLASSYAAPVGELQTSLTRIWGHLLGIDQVGVTDDFFDLGGDSLLAVDMMTTIHDQLGLDLPLGALARARTIADMCDVIEDANSKLWDCLVPMKTLGERTPLFVIHGGSGNVASFSKLAEALPEDQPSYAIQWDGLDGTRGSRSIDAMADRYLAEIREVQPQGPYLLAGQCIGGLIAREMGRRLEGEDETVGLVVMYDSPNRTSEAYVGRRIPFVLFQLKRTLFGASAERTQRVRVYLRSWLGLRISPKDRERYGRLMLIRAAWRYRPEDRPSNVPTLYVGSGEKNASRIALIGRWTDDAMGWSDHAGPDFEIVQVDAKHNDIPYDATSVTAVETAMAAAAVRAISPKGTRDAAG